MMKQLYIAISVCCIILGSLILGQELFAEAINFSTLITSTSVILIGLITLFARVKAK